MPWNHFARQLRDTYAASLAAAHQTATPREPASDAPEVFLCYASEDREAVEALGDGLQARGIRIWRDKQNLRTGQRWDVVLMDVIQNVVNYVVVVQSATMVNRPEAWYRIEIDEAMKRRKRFDESRYIFVLPVLLPGGSRMPGLEQLHTDDIDVSSDAGLDRLARTILDDWARPLRRGSAKATA